MSVVDLSRAIATDSDAKLMVFEKLCPPTVQKRPIGLDAVLDRYTATSPFRLKIYGGLIEIEAGQERFTTVPNEFCIRLIFAEKSDEILKRASIHQISFVQRLCFVKKIAVVASHITQIVAWLYNDGRQAAIVHNTPPEWYEGMIKAVTPSWLYYALFAQWP